MKALLLVDKKKLEMTDLPAPSLAAGDLLVRVKACGICGSDVHGFDGSTGRRIPPVVMGHEAAGVIEQIGTDVENFRPGDHITFDSTIYCGQCDFCRAGKINLCDHRRVLGVSCGEYRQDGCFAEFVAIPQRIAYRLPDAMTFEEAAMVEAVSIAVHAVSRANIKSAATLVVGAGMIGQLIIQAARAAGCGMLIAVDLDESRLQRAKQFGADHVFNADSPDLAKKIQELMRGGVDVAFDAVGISASTKTAVGSARKGASIVLVGNISPQVEMPLQAIVTRELSLFGSCASRGEYPQCLDLMAGGKIDVHPLISAVAPLEEGPQWFNRLYARESGLMKVILKPLQKAKNVAHRIKTGLIGTGKVADIHAAALASLPQSQFTAVCGSTLEKSERFAARYNVKGYSNLGQMLEESGVEAVCICTPHPRHAEPAIVAAKRGIHVLVEKPLASSLADCDRMISAARESGVTLGVFSQRRFYAPCRRIHDAIDAGKIGNPILGSIALYGWRDEKYYKSDPWRGSWKGEGGGVLVNQAPHQLDLLLWYMGPVAELCGYWANLNHPYIEVEDTAVASLRFQNGALGQIILSNSQNPALYGKVQIHGSNGATIGVQTDGGAMFIAGVSGIAEPPYNDVWTIPGEADLRVAWQKEDAEFFSGINPMEHYHRLQIQDFLAAIEEKRPPLVTAEDGRRTVELFTAIYRSQRDRAPVGFPLSPEKS